MAKTKLIKLYEYSELSEKAQSKALRNFRENGFDDYSLQVDLDNELETLLAEHGIQAIRDLKGYETKWGKLYYSLSNCQGDGVMFEGVFSFPTETEKEGGQWKRYEVTVKHSGHYYHSNSKTIEVQEDATHTNSEAVEKEFEAVYQKICDQLEKRGYEIIDDMQSEAYFIEQCNANEYTFREDGTMENDN